MRHKVKIFDLGFIAILLAVAGLFAFEVDVFENQGRLTLQQQTLELDELMVFTTLLMAATLFYVWRRAREHARENARRIEAEKEVLTLALHDPLTGLPNRRQFDEALKSALTTIPEAPEAHAVFLLDLNGFKKINDIHGHPIGDQVLIHVGSRLLRAVRDGDLVARLGGDEFAILARNVAGSEAATTIARRIVEGLASPIAIGRIAHNVGTAIGIALSPHDGDEGSELLRKADVALYRAKTEHESAIRFFEPEMDERLKERDDLERSLRTSFEQDGFVVDFLPSLSLSGDRLASLEALPIWRHPTLGELEPERFLPIAEEAGLLADLTEQLMTKACAAAAQWPADIRLAFNLPSPLLTDLDFGLRILRTLGGTGLSPNRFDLEIDEGALIRHAEAAQAILTPLRAAGVSIVADHFGTGYSDLKNLHRLRLDRVKIDPSLTTAMLQDRQAAVMVKALIGIGQGLDLAIIADGVQTDEQRAALAAQGCEQGQGTLYGGRMSMADVLGLVVPAPEKADRPASN